MVNMTDFACRAAHLLCFTCLQSALCFDNKRIVGTVHCV